MIAAILVKSSEEAIVLSKISSQVIVRTNDSFTQCPGGTDDHRRGHNHDERDLPFELVSLPSVVYWLFIIIVFQRDHLSV